jgi:hypothetical protein
LGELTTWTVWRQWGPRRLADLDAWLVNVVVLGYDEGVAKTLGSPASPRAAPRPAPPDQRQLDRSFRAFSGSWSGGDLR